MGTAPLGVSLLEAVIDRLSGWGVQSVFDKALFVFKMRFGALSTVGAAAALGGLVHAQCPDYTTFSQVCWL